MRDKKHRSRTEKLLALQSRLVEGLLFLRDMPRPLIIFDYPNYTNVGDAALWLGTIACLKKIGARFVTAISPRQTQRLIEQNRSGTIVFGAGGYFGSLWVDSHLNRLRLLNSYRNMPAVQLPQSVYFQDDGLVQATRDAILSHGAFRMLVRDEISKQRYSKLMGLEAELVPDMAFAIGEISIAAKPAHERIGLFRTDHESLGRQPVDFPVFDWIHGASRLEKLASKLCRRAPGFNVVDRWVGSTTARIRLNRGLAIIGQGREIHTDRLHGVILSYLAGKDCVAYDNVDGKVRALVSTWSSYLAGVRMCNI